MTHLAQAISRALIHFIWQGTVVGLLLWMILPALKKKSANARYAAACAALGLMAILPVLTGWLLYVQPDSSSLSGTVAMDPPQMAESAAAAFHFTPWVLLAWLQKWAVRFWSVGVLLLSVRLVLGYRHAFYLARRGKPASDAVAGAVGRLVRSMGVERRVRVLISSVIETPSVVGWLRPVILLPPATLLGLTPLQLEAILAHEIGHIKRYDYLINMAQMAVETLLFYHPAVWWTSKRIRLERELCCDDLAVQFSGDALRYARALTTLEKLRLNAPAVAMASTGGSLLYRIQRLAGVTSEEYGPSRLPVVFAAALGVMCLMFSVTWVSGQDAPGVRVDLGGSSLMHRPSVPYPESLSKQSVNGTVQLEVTLDDSGNVTDARVLSGPQELRKTSLESVLNWHFAKDAAKSSRLVTISYSNDAKQVEISEPPANDPLTAWTLESVRTDSGKFIFETRPAPELTKRQQLERQIQDLKQKASVAEALGVADSARREIQLKIAKLQSTLESTPFEPVAGRVSARLVGNPIKAIGVVGLSDAARAELLSRLPIREGDILSTESLEASQRTVREYDEHLVLDAFATADGQAEIRIGLRR